MRECIAGASAPLPQVLRHHCKLRNATALCECARDPTHSPVRHLRIFVGAAITFDPGLGLPIRTDVDVQAPAPRRVLCFRFVLIGQPKATCSSGRSTIPQCFRPPFKSCLTLQLHRLAAVQNDPRRAVGAADHFRVRQPLCARPHDHHYASLGKPAWEAHQRPRWSPSNLPLLSCPIQWRI